ncbi:MAG: hypothetical protein M1813_002231 [Trichoglossum hirsutum]|nr:MAG: hypothetical protein M1813_002231 [Trichoglossum hirsutum]
MERQMMMNFAEYSKAHYRNGRWYAYDRAWPPEQIMEQLFNGCTRSYQEVELGVAKLFSAAGCSHQRGSGACSRGVSELWLRPCGELPGSSGSIVFREAIQPAGVVFLPSVRHILGTLSPNAQACLQPPSPALVRWEVEAGLCGEGSIRVLLVRLLDHAGDTGQGLGEVEPAARD